MACKKELELEKQIDDLTVITLSFKIFRFNSLVASPQSVFPAGDKHGKNHLANFRGHTQI